MKNQIATKSTKRSDKKAKEEFINILKSTHLFDNYNIETAKPTDVVVKIGENKTDWFFFELKTTTAEILNKNGKYFSAVSINQWKEAIMYKGHYYFVLVLQDDSQNTENFKYIILTPQCMLSYLTGCYVHTDFTIKNEAINNSWKNKKEIPAFLSEISNKQFTDTIEFKHQESTETIKKLSQYLADVLDNANIKENL